MRDVPQSRRGLELHQSVHALRPAPRLSRAISRKLLAERDAKALELFHNVEEVKHEAAEFMKVQAVWQFFEAERDGNAHPPVRARRRNAASTRSTSAASRSDDGLCLSDYILDPRRRPARSPGAVRRDGGRGRSRALRRSRRTPANSSRRTRLQALAIETAEGCAEWLHRRIREDWGFPDPPTMTMQERFTSRYRGKRYSFGYPACPNLDDQQGIWKLLRPEEIGVQLTEGMMMEPEASVSALVFHHPDCAYFTAAEEAEAGVA